MKNKPNLLQEHLQYLKLNFIGDQHSQLASQAATQQWDHLEYLRRLIEGEYSHQRHRRVQWRLKSAEFPVLETLEQFRWDWPKKINPLLVRNFFRLEFIEQKAKVVLLGPVGVGKTHLATALGYAACLEGQSVMFADAIAVVKDLQAAQQAGALKRTIKKYLRPRLLILDEVGYLPIDQRRADLLFQVISQRHERGSIILTTNKPFKDWASTTAPSLSGGVGPAAASCRYRPHPRHQLSHAGSRRGGAGQR